jgi:hypothetical protein
VAGRRAGSGLAERLRKSGKPIRSLAARIWFRHARLLKIGDRHRQVRLHLFPTKQSGAPNALEPEAKAPAPFRSYHNQAMPMTRAIAPVISLYRSVSADNLFRPSGVSV